MNYLKLSVVALVSILSLFTAVAQEANPFVQFEEVEETYELYLSKGKPRATVTKDYLFAKNRLSPVAHMDIVFNDNIKYSYSCRSEVAVVGEEKMAYSSSILHNDTKVRGIDFYLYNGRKKFRKYSVTYEYLDATYLTTLYLEDDYKVQHKTVKIIIPKDMPYVKVHEFFFGDSRLQGNMVDKGGKRIYTITMTDLPASRSEKSAPASRLHRPHIVLDCAFKDHKDLYNWNRKMIDVDCTIDGIEDISSSIVKGCKTDEEKIAAIYSYVQSNIRYIAFEAGQEGFRPDRPSEILRKKYGDCKGMAILLRTLLRSQGFDARYGIIGTTERPYKISEISSVCVANHAICVLYHKGTTYYLDATYKNIPYNAIPGHISGKQALVEDGEECKIETVPLLEARQSVDSISCDLTLKRVEGRYKLEGIAKRQAIGDSKEMLMTYTEKSKINNREALMRDMLECLSSQSVWCNLSEKNDKQGAVSIEGNMSNEYCVTEAEDELYIDTYMGLTYQAVQIDTFSRKYDYDLGDIGRMVRFMRVNIPSDYEI
ncbi:MAG: transglutaminase-like domain-containing protein [Bacteroidia bacterium]|nr:transglutaminase-like domain-containing protein [Bacteroidia bacterium]